MHEPSIAHPPALCKAGRCNLNYLEGFEIHGLYGIPASGILPGFDPKGQLLMIYKTDWEVVSLHIFFHFESIYHGLTVTICKVNDPWVALGALMNVVFDV